MDIVLFLAAAVLVTVGVWFIQQGAVHAFGRYQTEFQKQARDRLSEFFLFVDPAQLWVLNLALCAGIMLTVYILSGMGWLSAVVGVIVLFAPQGVISRYRRLRRTRFDSQLPDLLLSLAGALRAGSGVQAALRHIVAQSPSPLSQEFGLMLREQRMGISFETALGHLYKRMPSEAMGLVVSALNIAMHNGGNLSETLERIADTLRARLHMLGRIRALTSQGRMQAWVMACLPFAVAFALELIDPASMQVLWQTPAGWAVILLILFLEFIGVMLIRRIVNIDV